MLCFLRIVGSIGRFYYTIHIALGTTGINVPAGLVLIYYLIEIAARALISDVQCYLVCPGKRLQILKVPHAAARSARVM